MEEVSNIPSTAVATELLGEPDTDGFAPAQAWALAPPLRFASDWRGENADLARETEVRLLWTNESLYLRFRCSYRTLTVFSDGGDSNSRRDSNTTGVNRCPPLTRLRLRTKSKSNGL